MAKIARHCTKIAAFLVVNCRFSGLNVTCGAGLHLDEAEHVAILSQIELAARPLRPPITRHHHISLAAEKKTGIVLVNGGR